MFQSWRLKIRQAEDALRGGRLEEACRLLERENLTEFLPGRKLSAKVAEQMLRRAEDRCLAGDSSAGWRDVYDASRLAGENEAVQRTRGALLARGIERAERYLEKGAAREALAQLDRLEKRWQRSEQIRVLQRVGRHVLAADEAGRTGDYVEAENQLKAAAALRPDFTWFQQRLAECRLNRAEVRRLDEELHNALSRQDWSQVLVFADTLLAIAPESKLGRSARRRAWAAVDVITSSPGGADRHQHSAAVRFEPSIPRTAARSANVNDRTPGERFMLWVDAVGGYLVCLGDEIVIGRRESGGPADIPILADLSRQHARICRDAEDYLIEPIQHVQLDGRRLTSAAALNDGHIMELGSGVEVRFRRPHRLSNTARLDLVSHHRTQPLSDGILLLAENCVLGRSWQNHVVCDDWEHDLMLFRHGDELYCRCAAPMEIDGVTCSGSQRIDYGSRICGADFSLSLEAI